jgi:putative FmdB family regulatory protein
MPIYEYQCTKCSHHLEALQKISDKPLRECPECGKHTLKRLMSAPMFRLAGSGWYETDFKSDKEKKRNLVGDKGEGSGTTDATAKIEPKAASKDDAKSDAKTEPSTDRPSPEKKSSRTVASKPAAKAASRSAAKAKSPARKPAARSRKR